MQQFQVNVDVTLWPANLRLAARQESVFQWILAQGLELRTRAKEFSWQGRLGPYRLDSAGR